MKQVSLHEALSYFFLFIAASFVFWFIGSPIKITKIEKEPDAVKKTRKYCLKKNSIGRFSDPKGGFCCKSTYPFPIPSTDKFICRVPDNTQINALNTSFEGNYRVTRLDDQRETEGGILLELSRNSNEIGKESYFLISSSNKRKKRKKIKKTKLSPEIKKGVSQCRKFANNLIDNIEKDLFFELDKKRKKKLNDCYQYTKKNRQQSRNRSWTGWNHIAMIKVQKNSSDEYLIQYSDASGECGERYKIENANLIKVEYIDFDKKSDKVGFCNLEAAAKAVSQYNSKSYIIHEVGRSGQILDRVEGPINVDEGEFMDPIVIEEEEETEENTSSPVETTPIIPVDPRTEVEPQPSITPPQTNCKRLFCKLSETGEEKKHELFDFYIERGTNYTCKDTSGSSSYPDCETIFVDPAKGDFTYKEADCFTPCQEEIILDDNS